MHTPEEASLIEALYNEASKSAILNTRPNWRLEAMQFFEKHHELLQDITLNRLYPAVLMGKKDAVAIENLFLETLKNRGYDTSLLRHPTIPDFAEKMANTLIRAVTHSDKTTPQDKRPPRLTR